MTDRLGRRAVLHRVVVEALGATGERSAHLAEPSPEELGVERRQVADRRDPELAQGLGRPLADAPQAGDRERGEERRLRAGRDDDERIGLAQVAGRPSRRAWSGPPPRRSSSPSSSDTSARIRSPIASPSPNSAADAVTSRNASSIEMGSTSGVNRRRIVITSRLTSVYLAPSTGQEDRRGAQRRGRPERHRRVDAELAGLVAGGRDDATVRGPATADDDRPAAQLRSVALLDGCEERIEVDVEDGPVGHPSSCVVPARGLPGARSRAGYQRRECKVARAAHHGPDITGRNAKSQPGPVTSRISRARISGRRAEREPMAPAYLAFPGGYLARRRHAVRRATPAPSLGSLPVSPSARPRS